VLSVADGDAVPGSVGAARAPLGVSGRERAD